MMEWWQNIPMRLDPIALTIGSFSLYWYAVFFLFGWVAAYGIARYRFSCEGSSIDRDGIADLFLWGLLGVLVGGRIGYALFYNHSLFAEPFRLISPYGADGAWSGISGMSYFGGLIGVVFTFVLLSRKRGWSFWKVADFLVPSVPIALLFGRLGNFVNVELPGRVTEAAWGMRFPFDPMVLRHPSTLYEAAFEGAALFVILWILRKKDWPVGALSAIFLVLYGCVRFVLECFREPDLGDNLFFDWMTTGQALALSSVFFGVMLFISIWRWNRDILSLNR